MIQLVMNERPDWERLAKEHPECRCFIEFAYANRDEFYSYLKRRTGEIKKNRRH